MIPRTLVPKNVRPMKDGEAKTPGHRLETYMDDRTVVPSGISDAPPLDGKTTIPSYLPLGVLVDRTLVPRGMPAKPIERLAPFQESVSIAVLDSRVVVPAYVEPAAPEDIQEFEHPPEMTEQLREVIEPDIFITGDANLLIEPTAKKDAKWDAFTRFASVVVHIALILFIISIPKLFPPHVPTQAELDMARKELNFVYLPPDIPEAPPAPLPKVRVSPKTLAKVAPPRPKPEITAPVQPQPSAPAPNLPEAPKPQTQLPSTAQVVPTPPAPSHLEPVLPVTPQPNKLNLGLSQSSPGKMLDNQLDDAIRNRPSGSYIPPSGGGGLGGNGQHIGAGLQILTDTQGVDFSDYMTRLKAIVERNWWPLMPESARMGEKGIVGTRIRIYRDGSMSAPYPVLDRTSGRVPLDNAAMGALHASNPFPPLPSQFKGPYIDIEGYFLYNIDPNSLH
jgi:TonB C terminal